MHVGMWLLQLRGILLVLLSAAIIQVETQILSSTLPSDNRVCPGEKVIFMCVVQGPHLSWSSDEYIGRESDGKRLEFATVDNLTETKSYNSSTVATLVNRNGVTETESRLEIIVSEEYSNSSVVCNDVSAGTSQPVHFSVIVPPGEYLKI